MSPQTFHVAQAYPDEISSHIGDSTAYLLVPTTHDDDVLFGDLAYNFLALDANAIFSQYVPTFLGFPPSPEDSHVMADRLSPAPSPRYAATPDATSLSLLSPSPSSPLSHSSSTPEPHYASIALPTASEPSCHQATPMFNHIRGKWCCSVCERCFRGKWECGRHINGAGKRAKCLACGIILKARGDSLQRHFKRYCKGDLRAMPFEDTFVDV